MRNTLTHRMTNALPPRSAVPAEQTWDLHSVYPSDEAWAAEQRAAIAALPELVGFAGRLGDSAATLLAALQARDRQRAVAWRLYQYASMQSKADLSDQAAAARLQQGRAIESQAAEALAYFEPELLAIDPARLAALMRELPELVRYQHYIDTLQRRAAHVAAPEVERVLAAAGDLAAGPYATYKTLVNAEIDFGTIPGAAGAPIVLAQGNARQLITSRDRPARQAAWQAYADGHLRMQNTLAHTLAGAVNRDVLFARARGYPSALDAALDASQLPRAVFDNLLASCQNHLPLWHRYWEIRRRALGLEMLHGYDIDVPLARCQRSVSYDQARALVCAALEPLGEEYTGVLRRGLYEERWVDWASNAGKLAGAESSGAPGTHPFLLLSYDNSLIGVSTLAHELGHSMHSYFTWQNQPVAYTEYADFVGETASNFNQALLRAHLLQTDTDAGFQLEVLDEALAYFHRYLFLMPLLARFEVECHARVERGEALTANAMSAIMVELFRAGYGPSVAIDMRRVGIAWAQFPHLFLNFYTYQYALGIAAASALAEEVLRAGQPAAARYLDFLKAGASVDPLDALRLAGVDMTIPEPVERAFGVLEGLIDRLEQLVGDR